MSVLRVHLTPREFAGGWHQILTSKACTRLSESPVSFMGLMRRSACACQRHPKDFANVPIHCEMGKSAVSANRSPFWVLWQRKDSKAKFGMAKASADAAWSAARKENLM